MNISINTIGTTVGIDIGSTTAKIVVVRDGALVYSKYQRHFSMVRQKTLEMLSEIKDLLVGEVKFAISGSAGLGLAEAAGIPFVQEVFATGEVVKTLEPETDAVIELGGEDAKIIFLTGGFDERMNGSCAGGTGAFIDQMATLLAVTPDELDELSLNHDRIYPIASRCGVFAKTDIQPLLNQGAKKENIAASIYQSVVNQTIAGLAQGRKLEGKIMFLGGPLYYNKGLRERFVKTLNLKGNEAVFPEYALVAVALGASIFAAKSKESFTYEDIIERITNATGERKTGSLPPLFKNKTELEDFKIRHAKATVETVDISSYRGDAYLGIDCGSTTTKVVLIAQDDSILYTYYSSNNGNPVEIIREQLEEVYKLCENRINIKASAVTGYGEELIMHAFGVDTGIVETIAHFTAARHFNPNVDFIIDIGGQDIKCFKVHNNSIDSIMLNEACSSGCGSFIETFAKNLGYDNVSDFSAFGLLAKAPVELGTRCTVFMNSSVKQAQKDGADVTDISAGLSMSVVKNAIYKVIRAGSADELGKEIVVQGGTFLNDAVLRSFEMLLGRNVVRPTIAGLMGAYGAALYVKGLTPEKTTIISPEDLKNFQHKSTSATCKGCTNNCKLTINTFSTGEKFVSGNQCERGAGLKAPVNPLPNLHAFKRDKLASLGNTNGKRGKIGIPLSLGMYELAPLWNALFEKLGFSVIFSGFSNRKVYQKGQHTIPSDTACYPAKIMHGHIETLLDKNVDAVFYPCLSYNVDEKRGDNHYNCPVVAYYSELLAGNVDDLKKTKFLYPYLNINNEKIMAKSLYEYLSKYFDGIKKSEVKVAVKCGMEAYKNYMAEIKAEGKRAVKFARENGHKIMILAGRPYHIDPEIGHGIDKLATSLGFVVVSEDSVSDLSEMPEVHVLNQWTYHSRLYTAARFACENDDVQLVQMVSFGCGVDAITTDEVRSILEKDDKLYTQIKIDEITNLGAVKIRLRSLLGALEEREKANAEK